MTISTVKPEQIKTEFLDPEELSDSIFGTSGGPVNLASQYEQCSYGQLTFRPATHTKVVDGVLTVSIGNTVTGVNDAVIRNAAVDAAEAKLGVSGTDGLRYNVADHVMACLPPGTSGGWMRE
jgi:hypothetical protein